MKNFTSCVAGALCGAALFLSVAGAQQPFPDAHDPPLPGWMGPVFQLSQDFPATMPDPEEYPWTEIDFRTEPEAYIRSVLEYAYEGNVDVDWIVQNNAVRAWYHAPWMHWGNAGREFIRGMTRERDSRPGELHPNQVDRYQNWAVSIYSAPGGFTIGQVWKDPMAPNPSAAIFPEGTVSIKLLFTQADPAQVPFLAGSPEWEGHIHTSLTSTARSLRTLRLLQIDVAVRDSRATDTGWVFGTFTYNTDEPGATAWHRVRPVGIMWGNDPGVTPDMVAMGTMLTESWINPNVGTPQHLGWAGRLNGPVDNPQSSCLSCHSTAQHRARSRMLPPGNASVASRLRWFRNIGPEEPFDDGEISLGYSLQLGVGIQNFEEWKATVETLQPPSFRLLDTGGLPLYRISRDEDEIVPAESDSQFELESARQRAAP